MAEFEIYILSIWLYTLATRIEKGGTHLLIY